MQLQPFLRRPRYLRAIPSLVVLTTAMAWGVMPDSDSADTAREKARVTLSQPRAHGAPPPALKRS
ncbi:MAG: hypothetical protein JWQ72_3000 [Polaromonas sp.]|nr:hypothetical protein [Polaromonas sp.]